MNFFGMQSLGTYAKNMEMQMKWQRKKKNNDFTVDGSTKLNDPVARQAEEIRKAQADGSKKLSSQIRTKLAAGKKLTWDEIEYLRKNDPQTYQKVKSLEAERKSYEAELKKCETKEDVERVKMNRTAEALSVVNNVKGNSAIPEGAKLGIIWQELQKNMVMEEAVKEFIESGRYAELPTEAEKMEAEKELREAERAEAGIQDPGEDIKEEEAVEKENGSGSASVDDAALGDHAHDKNVRQTSSDRQEKEAEALEIVQRSRTVLKERKMLRAEAETTPEALKVKHARARAAYKENQTEIPDLIIDRKAE